MMAMTFFGNERLSEHIKSHLHESPKVMLIPLYLLAILAIFGGLLRPALPILNPLPEMANYFPGSEHGAMILSTLLGIFGLFLGLYLFRQRHTIAQVFKVPAFLQKLLENKYYLDEVYDFLFCRPGRFIAQVYGDYGDRYFFDVLIRVSQRSVLSAGQYLKIIQSGDLQAYLLTLIIGLAALLLAAWVIY